MPGCIHCRNLQPAYEKSALWLADFARVAAVNCEDESSIALCNKFGIQSFPSLKIFKPGKTPGKPIVSEYQSSRTTKAITEAVMDKIPNLVEKPNEENFDKWVQDAGERPVAILLTNKPRIHALLKALAIDFKGSTKFAHFQISNYSKGIDKIYEYEKLPALVLLPNGKNGERLLHNGDMKKTTLVEFLSQAATPNPDAAHISLKEGVLRSSSHKGTNKTQTKTTESAMPLVILKSEDELVTQCMGSKTGTCFLAVLPDLPNEATPFVDALTHLVHKFKQQKRPTIPAFILPKTNPKYKKLETELSLEENVALIALNGKRKWWNKLTEVDLSTPLGIQVVLENWISTIQLGEGEKKSLPSTLIHEELDDTMTNNSDQMSSFDGEEKTENGKFHNEL